MKTSKVVAIISCFAVLANLRILINPSLILERNNDLNAQFWPVFYFIKQQFFTNYSLPLWNNLFLSGTPLLPDPQFSLFYPPNLLFIILPINTAFIIYLLLHSFLAGLGIYLLCKRGLNFSQSTSLFSVVLYLTTPKLAGFLEAGHIGLFTSFALLPFIAFASLMLIKKPKFLWSLLLAVSLAGTFYTHTIIFILSIVCTAIFTISILITTNSRKTSIVFLILAAIFTSGFIAVTLLPQLEWLPQTTRFLLTQTKDVYPKWGSIREFLQITLLPLSLQIKDIWLLDPEKWIATGTISTIFAFYGFLHLRIKFKLLILLSVLFTSLIALNNASPFYPVMIKFDWYALMRVSTRIWFIPILLVTILCSFALEQMNKHRFKKIFIVGLATLAVTEQLTLSNIYLSKPVENISNLAPKEVYDYIKKDPELFRIYCVNRCLSQEKAAKYSFQLVDGYNTLQQKNYFQESWQLTGAYWNYYTLSIPPFGIYTFEKPQPDPVSLGDYNTKYIISPYPLTNDNFHLEKQIANYFIYTNRLLKPRAYFTERDKPNNFKEAPIIKYTPNKIVVDTTNQTSLQLTLAEVYSKGWKAYLNGKKGTSVQERPNRLRLVDIQPDTKFVVFEYKPLSYVIGKWISLATIILCLLLLQFKQFKKI